MKELIKRTISGIVFVTLIIGLLIFHQAGMLVLLLIVSFFSLNEYFLLEKQSSRITFLTLSGSSALLIILSYLSASGIIQKESVLLSILVLFPANLVPILFLPGTFHRNWSKMITGLVYISLPLALIPYIAFKNEIYDYTPVLGIFIILWVYDSFAYLTGRIAGKTKLAPMLSPNKTWEGALGGLCFTLLAVLLLTRFSTLYSLKEWLILSSIIMISGTIGDLTESALKRNAGVKDSGKFLPGHGGFLDRFDSFLFSVPFVFLYIYFQ